MTNRIMKHPFLDFETENEIYYHNKIYYHIDGNGFVVDVRGSNEEIKPKKRKQYRGIKFYKVKEK